MSYLPNIPKIQYEGPSSKNPFAFKHYKPDETVAGKPRLRPAGRSDPMALSGASRRKQIPCSKINQLQLGAIVLGMYLFSAPPALAGLVSEDVVKWREAEPFTFMKKEFPLEDGSIWKPTRVERPFVLTDEKGTPEMLYLAVRDEKHNLNANVAIPLNVTVTQKKSVRSVITYPAVTEEGVSKEYSVKVNGEAVPVYVAKVCPTYNKHPKLQSPIRIDDYSFASFESSGPVEVVVESTQPLTSLTIRPSAEGVPVKLEGNTARFTLERNGNFLIERNGNGRTDPLLIFSNPLEISPPRQGDPGVIYFGPGRHKPGLIELSDNQTLYIAGGAVVTGRVIAKGDNITIRGRGLLENSVGEAGGPYNGKHMILLDRCTRARVEGITIRKNSQHWTVVAKMCDDVKISNIKICGSFGQNDDGIDICNSRNVLIEDCFIRTKDDCIAFKGLDDSRRNCEDITVTRCSLWSDRCATLLFGDESGAEFMRNITVKDCHVLFLSYELHPKKFLMLHAGEDMRMENLLFENIDIYGEGQKRNFMEITCEFNNWCKRKTAGSIRNVTLRNVHLTGKAGDYDIVIKGFNENRAVEDVTFENCTILGKPLSAKYPNLKIGEFTRNIRFQ